METMLNNFGKNVSAVQREQLIGQLEWRYATKQFDPTRKISPQDWTALEEALVLTPSSFGLQPWKFIVVTDPVLRERLVPVSWGQRQIVDSSHLVVFTIKTGLAEKDIDSFIAQVAKIRGIAPESLGGYRDMMVNSIIKGMDETTRGAWAARQVYIALGNFMTSAAILGIDACPMEGLEPQKYDEILSLNKQGLSTVVVATAGYRAASDKYASLKKVRFPKSEVLVQI